MALCRFRLPDKDYEEFKQKCTDNKLLVSDVLRSMVGDFLEHKIEVRTYCGHNILNCSHNIKTDELNCGHKLNDDMNCGHNMNCSHNMNCGHNIEETNCSHNMNCGHNIEEPEIEQYKTLIAQKMTTGITIKFNDDGTIREKVD